MLASTQIIRVSPPRPVAFWRCGDRAGLSVRTLRFEHIRTEIFQIPQEQFLRSGRLNQSLKSSGTSSILELCADEICYAIALVKTAKYLRETLRGNRCSGISFVDLGPSRALSLGVQSFSLDKILSPGGFSLYRLWSNRHRFNQ